MKKLTLIIAMCAISATAVHAGGDLKGSAYESSSPSSDYNWTGFSVGAHVGHLTGETSNDTGGILPDGSADSWFGGVQAGYRRHLNNDWVLGLGVTVPLASEDQSLTTFGNLNTVKNKGSVRVGAQLGHAMGRLMPFVTAGVGAAWIEAREVLANGTASPWVDNTHAVQWALECIMRSPSAG